MIKCLRKVLPIFFLFLVVCLFFYKTIFKGLIPFPGDMLVGAYYPWLDYKRGGLFTSVPIKNPLISDVFSGVYLGKLFIADSFKSLILPFWNPFSYSGHPLLAGFGGVFNPFNLLMVIFKPISGWILMVFCQYFLSAVAMFLFLKEKYKNNFSNIIGAISYGFCGFAAVWSQYVSAGFAMIWLPLIFLNIERFFKTKEVKYLFYLSPLYFLLMTAGRFQALIYGCFFSGFYFLWKLFHYKENLKKSILFYSIAVILGLALMAIQLFPTIELSKNSIRFSENYISNYNYGLLPLYKIVTFFAPDFFGNPTTSNYRGEFNYFETVIYVGILAVFGLIFSIYNFKKLKDEKFFLISAFISVLLVFNTFLGKIIYITKVPGLSTSAAGRIIFIFSFCLTVLIANFIEKISLHNLINTLRYYWGYFLFLFLTTAFTFILYKKSFLYTNLQKDYLVSLRNLFLPIIFSFSIAFILAFIKNFNLKRILILFIVILDLFRFGWKFIPFTNKEYLYPKTDITTFLQNQLGLFRIEKEKGAILPSSTWMAYNLSSTSGYDPMALYSYSYFYDEFLNKSKTPSVSRYSEIDKYDAQNLGETNVKYLLAFKYKKDGNIDKISSDGDYLNSNISTKDWKKVYEYGSVIILENQKFKPRIEIKNKKNQGSISNLSYSANKITFNTNTTENNSTLILRDTWYPGWHAFVDNTEVPINKYLNIYRQIYIPKGESSIKFIYQPKSFIYGFYTFISALIIWSVFIIKFKHKKI